MALETEVGEKQERREANESKRNRKNMKLSIIDSQTNGEEEMAKV